MWANFSPAPQPSCMLLSIHRSCTLLSVRSISQVLFPFFLIRTAISSCFLNISSFRTYHVLSDFCLFDSPPSHSTSTFLFPIFSCLIIALESTYIRNLIYIYISSVPLPSLPPNQSVLAQESSLLSQPYLLSRTSSSLLCLCNRLLTAFCYQPLIYSAQGIQDPPASY